MSLRRSSRRSQPDVAQAQPNGKIAETANVSKKRGRKTKASDVVVEDAVAQDVPAGASSDTVVMPPPPTTPNKRRKVVKTEEKPPPFTPTPSVIGLMTETNGHRTNYSTGDIDDPPPPPQSLTRPAEPHHTNAALVTPGGTQVLPFSNFEESPTRPSTRPHTTTTTLLEEACTHLIKVDPALQPVITKFPCHVFSPAGLAEEIDPFRSLASGIMAQQVSGAAARSIKNKLIALFPPESCPRGFPTPAAVAETPLPRLREAGLSQRKAEYIQGLAGRFASGELTVRMLLEDSDAEVMRKLVAVRGLGPWSVEMFMCFGLKRMDVFSTGDLGVQRGMAAHAGRDVKRLKSKAGNNKWKYMSEKEMLETSEKYSPYRSLYMWYMWRIEDVDTVALEDNAST